MLNSRMNEPNENWFKCTHQFYALMPEMSEAELRVMLVAQRKILGWHKPLNVPEPISLSQFVNDSGMAEETVRRGIAQAVERGWLVKVEKCGPRNTSGYMLDFANTNETKTATYPPYGEGSESDVPHDDGSTSPMVKEEPPSRQGTQKIGKKEIKKNTTQPTHVAATEIIETDLKSGNENPSDSSSNTSPHWTKLEKFILEATKTTYRGLAPTYITRLNQEVLWFNGEELEEAVGDSPNALYESDTRYAKWLREEVIVELHNQYRPPHQIPVKELVKRICNYQRFYAWRKKIPAQEEQPSILVKKVGAQGFEPAEIVISPSLLPEYLAKGYTTF